MHSRWEIPQFRGRSCQPPQLRAPSTLSAVAHPELNNTGINAGEAMPNSHRLQHSSKIGACNGAKQIGNNPELHWEKR